MELTKQQKERLEKLIPNISKGVARDVSYKAEMINLYNEIYKQNYKTTTNCASCLNSAYKGIMKLYEN